MKIKEVKRLWPPHGQQINKTLSLTKMSCRLLPGRHDCHHDHHHLKQQHHPHDHQQHHHYHHLVGNGGVRAQEAKDEIWMGFTGLSLKFVVNCIGFACICLNGLSWKFIGSIVIDIPSIWIYLYSLQSPCAYKIDIKNSLQKLSLWGTSHLGAPALKLKCDFLKVFIFQFQTFPAAWGPCEQEENEASAWCTWCSRVRAPLAAGTSTCLWYILWNGQVI